MCNKKPTREQAEDAVRVLLSWAGDDINRDGIKDTPARVVRSYEEFFAGYDLDPAEYLARTFEENDNYDEMVLLKDIPFVSNCEHHMLPIIGKVHIAYIPKDRVVGISKLARVVNAYSKRLQIQEKLTAQIGNIIDEVLQPHGVAVIVEAEHQCMSIRGVKTGGSNTMITSKFFGTLKSNKELRKEFLDYCNKND